MWKLAALIWIMLGTTLAGTAVVAILATPSWYDRGMTLIPFGALAGFLLAVPLAVLVAKRIAGPAERG